MQSLSIDPLSIITQFLEPTDILSLQHTCRQLYELLSADFIWDECLNRHKSIKFRAIYEQINYNWPEYVIISCEYSYIFHEESDFINIHANQCDYKLVYIEGCDHDKVPDKVFDEDKYKVFKSLNLIDDCRSIVLYENKKNKFGDCVDRKAYVRYVREFVRMVIGSFYCDELFKPRISRGCKNGVYYMTLHYNE